MEVLQLFIQIFSRRSEAILRDESRSSIPPPYYTPSSHPDSPIQPQHVAHTNSGSHTHVRRAHQLEQPYPTHRGHIDPGILYERGGLGGPVVRSGGGYAGEVGIGASVAEIAENMQKKLS